MKHYYYSFLLCFLFSKVLFSQNPCVDFENASTNPWTSFYVDGIKIEKSPDQPGKTNVLHLSDGESPGWSVAINNRDFAGNWLVRGRERCLCFDYKIDWNTDVDQSAGTAPRIVIYTGPTLTDYNSYLNCLKAEFIGNATAPALQDNKWKNYCLPLAICENESLPSNALGTWRIFQNSIQLTGNAACNAWNQIIQNITGIMLVTDYNRDPSEDVYFDNFCFSRCPIEPNRGCCPNLINLVQNSEFNQPLSPSSSSQYKRDGPIGANSTLPGEYIITNGTGALNICKNWIVQDRVVCSPGFGSFMIVNGETTQPSNVNNIIWEQIVPNSQKDSSYRFCAFFKNLPACCFDVLPKIKVDIGSTTTGWRTINAGAGPCLWQQISLTFTGSGGPMVIRISLDEMGIGDGNDLAIDDISVYKVPKANIETIVSITGSQINASVGTSLGNSDDILPSAECEYFWVVGKFDPASNSLLTTPTPGIGNSALGSWFLTTNFPGYPFPMGTLSNPNYYAITLVVVNCNCLAQTVIRKIVSATPAGIKLEDNAKYPITEQYKMQLLKLWETRKKIDTKN